MTKAEAKRWNTWVNAMCIMTLIRRFYPKCFMTFSTSQDELELMIDVPGNEYNIDEIVADIDNLKEDSAKKWIYSFPFIDMHTITIKWKEE